MGFLLRTAFWFSLVLLVIPFDVGGTDGVQHIGPVDAFLPRVRRSPIYPAFASASRKSARWASRRWTRSAGAPARRRASPTNCSTRILAGRPPPTVKRSTGGIERLVEDADSADNADFADPVTLPKP